MGLLCRVKSKTLWISVNTNQNWVPAQRQALGTGQGQEQARSSPGGESHVTATGVYTADETLNPDSFSVYLNQ